jgi:3-ketosteroid 9alpha-monooxygenase subunit B
MSTYHSLRVRAVIEETPDSRTFALDVPPEMAEAFRYRPGQFLTLRLPVNGRHVPRCYSMSSAPGIDEGLCVTVKRVAGGRGSNWLCDHVRAGDRLEVKPPAGVFTPPSLDGDFLLFAGGSGITPVYSILRSALRAGRGRITLFYANRDERSVVFAQALRALASEHPDRLTVVHWLESVQGIPATAQLAAFARNAPGASAYICGPAPFMDAVVNALQANGTPEALVHVERFVSLPDEEAAAPPATPDPDGAPALEAEVEMALDGTLHRFRTRGGETLLDAARRHGIEPPYSCQAGLCAACMCQVVSGSVHLRHNEVLDPRDLGRGMTLSCQAVPTSPNVSIKYL